VLEWLQIPLFSWSISYPERKYEHGLVSILNHILRRNDNLARVPRKFQFHYNISDKLSQQKSTRWITFLSNFHRTSESAQQIDVEIARDRPCQVTQYDPEHELSGKAFLGGRLGARQTPISKNNRLFLP
jgi:hypothetical protein